MHLKYFKFKNCASIRIRYDLNLDLDTYVDFLNIFKIFLGNYPPFNVANLYDVIVKLERCYYKFFLPFIIDLNLNDKYI